jgi:hypothetical protein
VRLHLRPTPTTPPIPIHEACINTQATTSCISASMFPALWSRRLFGLIECPVRNGSLRHQFPVLVGLESTTGHLSFGLLCLSNATCPTRRYDLGSVTRRLACARIVSSRMHRHLRCEKWHGRYMYVLFRDGEHPDLESWKVD